MLLAKETPTPRIEAPVRSTHRVPSWEVARYRAITEVIRAVTTPGACEGLTIEDRRWQRHEYDGPLIVQPLGEDDQPEGPPIFVEGRDLSAGGLSFHHEEPLVPRFVAITFPFTGPEHRSVVAELSWCRFTRDGHYCSGGRFVRVVEGSPASRPA